MKQVTGYHTTFPVKRSAVRWHSHRISDETPIGFHFRACGFTPVVFEPSVVFELSHTHLVSGETGYNGTVVPEQHPANLLYVVEICSSKKELIQQYR